MHRILIIDDDKQVRELMVLWLEKAGYEIFSAKDGQEGVEKFYQEPPDLVITDLFMPAKDGMEVLVELKNYFPDVKILVVSGWEDQYLRAAKTLGAWRTLPKPFRMEQLLDLVKDALAEGL